MIVERSAPSSQPSARCLVRPRRLVLAAVTVLASLTLVSCTSGQDPVSFPSPTYDFPAAPEASAGATVTPPASSASPSTSPSPSATVATAQLASFYDQKLSWKGCGDSFQCATMQVPLDYANPSAASIGIAVNRLRADKSKKLGSLVLNPGGPGASGIDYAKDARSILTKKLRSRFDVVGFDPRGVGRSAPVKCLDAKATDTILAADGSPDSPAEEQELIALNKNFAEQCKAKSGAELEFVGTRDAARDLDVLRAVLGDDKLNYLGKSYGTSLGAAYAEQFPDRVGRLVLDGALDPSLTSAQVNAGQAAGFEQALGAFVDDCLKGKNCPLSGGREAALKRIDAYLTQVDAKPQVVGSRKVTQSLALLGIAVALYDNESWPYLRLALGAAFKGNADILLSLADVYTDRNENGTYANNANDAIYAVNCVDRPDTDSVDDVRRQAGELAKLSPRFGAYLAWSSLPCAEWPVPATGTAHKVVAAGAGPILVVGTTRDPATPYGWAKSLAEQLQSGRLLSWDGDGHTAYKRGSECVDKAVDAYFISGTLPAEGTMCH